MERAPWEPVKLQTSLTKGISLPVSSGLPSYMHFNMAACVQFLKHTFTEHLLRARHTLVWWILPQKKVFSAFTNCSQWGHSGFLSSQKCAGTPKYACISSSMSAQLFTIPFTTFAINPILISDFHFNTFVLDNSLFRHQIISNLLQLNVINEMSITYRSFSYCKWMYKKTKGKGKNPLSVPNTWYTWLQVCP